MFTTYLPYFKSEVDSVWLSPKRQLHLLRISIISIHQRNGNNVFYSALRGLGFPKRLKSKKKCLMFRSCGRLLNTYWRMGFILCVPTHFSSNKTLNAVAALMIRKPWCHTRTYRNVNFVFIFHNRWRYIDFDRYETMV